MEGAHALTVGFPFSSLLHAMKNTKCINKKIKLDSFAEESNLITFISDPENGKWKSEWLRESKRDCIANISLSLFAFNIVVVTGVAARRSHNHKHFISCYEASQFQL